MKRSIALLAFAGLAACAYQAPQTDITGQQFGYFPGTGVVESVSRAPLPITAAAGGTAPEAQQPLYRLAVRMDDGRLQYLDTDSTEFTRGTRVRLTEQRLIEKP